MLKHGLILLLLQQDDLTLLSTSSAGDQDTLQRGTAMDLDQKTPDREVKEVLTVLVLYICVCVCVGGEEYTCVWIHANCWHGWKQNNEHFVGRAVVWTSCRECLPCSKVQQPTIKFTDDFKTAATCMLAVFSNPSLAQAVLTLQAIKTATREDLGAKLVTCTL